MAIIRKTRTPNGTPLYQVVKSQKVGGRQKQQVLMSLSDSPTIGEYIGRVQARLTGLRGSRHTGDEGALRYSEDMLARLHRVQAETGLP